jgi:hypothetical protein
MLKQFELGPFDLYGSLPMSALETMAQLVLSAIMESFP